MFNQLPSHDLALEATQAVAAPTRALPLSLDMGALLAVLRRQWGLIAGVTLLWLVAAVLFVLIVPARYTATTQLLIKPTDLRIVEKSVTEAAAPVIDAPLTEVESQARVLTSENVLRRVIEQQQLTSDSEFGVRPSFIRNLLSGLLDTFNMSLRSDAPRDVADITLDNLKRRVTVKLLPRTYVVELAVTANERNKAVQIANAIARAYLEDQTEARAAAARRASNSLTSRLDELREAAQAADQRVEQFKRDNTIVAANGQLVTESQATELSTQLMSARARVAEKKARYDQIREMESKRIEPSVLTDAIQSQTMTALRTQYATVARREAELSSTLGPRHPQVLIARAELETARQLVKDEITRLVQAARVEYEQAKAQEASMSSALDQQKGDLLDRGDLFVRLKELTRDADAKRSVYEAFSSRARELREQSWVDTTNVRIISNAEPPTGRSWPPSTALLLAFAMFAGLGSGAGLAYLRDRGDDRISSERQLRAVGLPVLATFPDLVRLDRKRIRPVEAAAECISLYERIVDRTDAALARRLQTVQSLLAAGDTHRGRTVLLLAAGDGHAKTAVSLSIALNAAVAGERALLIGCDEREPALPAIFEVLDRPAALQIAAQRKSLSDTLFEDPATGLRFLPAGARGSADMLGRGRRFDLVLIDGKPDLSGAETRAYADAVDFVIVVAALGQTRAGELARLAHNLGRNRRKVAGVILVGAERDGLAA